MPCRITGNSFRWRGPLDAITRMPMPDSTAPGQESVQRISISLPDIHHEHIAEEISSLQVFLENNHSMEVILVQGPARTLRQIANKLLACKGVLGGRFNLSRIVLPPIHTAGE